MTKEISLQFPVGALADSSAPRQANRLTLATCNLHTMKRGCLYL